MDIIHGPENKIHRTHTHTHTSTHTHIHTHRRAGQDPVSASLHAYSQAIMFPPKTTKGRVDFTYYLPSIRYRLTNSKYNLFWAAKTHSAATHTRIHTSTQTHTHTHTRTHARTHKHTNTSGHSSQGFKRAENGQVTVRSQSGHIQVTVRSQSGHSQVMAFYV